MKRHNRIKSDCKVTQNYHKDVSLNPALVREEGSLGCIVTVWMVLYIYTQSHTGLH